MTDDPIDLSQVAADDAAIEQLRDAGFVGSDPALAMLRDLLLDIGSDLPEGVQLGHGSSQVTPLPNDTAPERRLARNGTLVALMTAGAVSLSGVAAASTLVSQSNPLHGLGEAVRSAAGAVVRAVTPPETPEGSGSDSRGAGAVPAPTDLPAATLDRRTTSEPSTGPRTSGPGAVASGAAARSAAPAAEASQAAARQVAALLDQAEALLDAGRPAAATRRLDTAERRLTAVLAADAAPLQARLTSLRERVAAATAAPERRTEGKPTPKPTPKPHDERADRSEPESEPAQQAKPTPAARAQPSRRSDGDKARQPSKDASAKPRA